MKEKLKKIMKEMLPETDVEQCEDFFDEGLDSIGVMTVITMIEKEFEIVIEPEDITAEYFLNIDGMMKMLEKYMS